MNTPGNRLAFTTASAIVRRAALDIYEDYDKVKGRFLAWAIDHWRELSNQVFNFGIVKMVINVNKNLNNAVLPCDFKKEIFIGVVDECGYKVPLRHKGKIVDIHNLEETPCDNGCPAKCSNCYDKGLCNDLTRTISTEVVEINDVSYTNTVTSTLLPNGTYKVEKNFYYYDIVDSEVKDKTIIEIQEQFDTAECGCIKITDGNEQLLKNTCYDAWVCHCTGCKESVMDIGGYNIFPKTGIIQFDQQMPYSKVYMEYEAGLPKSGGEYLIPEEAHETLIEYVKLKYVRGKSKSIAEKREQRDEYLIKRGNMERLKYDGMIDEIVRVIQQQPDWTIDFIGSCYNYAPQNQLDK